MKRVTAREESEQGGGRRRRTWRRSRKRRRGFPSVALLSMGTTAGAEPREQPELGTASRFPMRVTEDHVLEHYCNINR